MAMALQQLTELGELLVNRALENLEPPVGLQDASLNTQLNSLEPTEVLPWKDTGLSPASTAPSPRYDRHRSAPGCLA